MRSDELQIAETMEKQETRQRNEEMKEYLRKQMEMRHKKAEDEFKANLEEAARTQALLDQQEKGFYSYAEQAVKEWQQKGKNVTPLILELKNYKKKVF
jgi:phage pi2 protein 07